MLKWYWWRLNGNGFFWGMISGTAAAIITPLLFPGISPLYTFPFILLLSGAASIISSLLTTPEDEETLKQFYRTVRPWGFWKPVHEKVIAETPDFKKVFKRNIIVVFPSWFIPPLIGGYMLFISFNMTLLAALTAFCIIAFILIPLISKRVGCKNCTEKENCPWMA